MRQGNWFSIGSDSGLSPVRRQAIIWSNTVFVNWTLRNKLQWNLNQNTKRSTHENALKCRLRNGGHFDQGEMRSYEFALLHINDKNMTASYMVPIVNCMD